MMRCARLGEPALIVPSFPLDGARKQWLEKDAAKYPRTLAYLDRIEAEPAMRRAVEKGGRNNFSIFL